LILFSSNLRGNILLNAVYFRNLKFKQKGNDKMLNLKPLDVVAKEVIEGKWGNGQERIDRLKKAGYDYKLVQMKVNHLLEAQKGAPAPGRPVPPPPPPAKKPIEVIAKEVIQGKWGNGQERIDKLTKAGYDYKAVQAMVNKLL
jgi:hypothetical protein